MIRRQKRQAFRGNTCKILESGLQLDPAKQCTECKMGVHGVESLATSKSLGLALALWKSSTTSVKGTIRAMHLGVLFLER